MRGFNSGDFYELYRKVTYILILYSTKTKTKICDSLTVLILIFLTYRGPRTVNVFQ